MQQARWYRGGAAAMAQARTLRCKGQPLTERAQQATAACRGSNPHADFVLMPCLCPVPFAWGCRSRGSPGSAGRWRTPSCAASPCWMPCTPTTAACWSCQVGPVAECSGGSRTFGSVCSSPVGWLAAAGVQWGSVQPRVDVGTSSCSCMCMCARIYFLLLAIGTWTVLSTFSAAPS